MSKADLISMLDTVSVQDLKSLVVAREKLDKLLVKRSQIEKQLSSIDQEITSIQKSIGTPTQKKASAKTSPAVRRKRKSADGRRKKGLPSIESLIVEILRERKGPVSVNDIADTLLTEKGYKTRSANFKNQLRVLLYRNQKGLFNKVDAGQFELSESGKAAGVEKTAEKKAPAAQKKVGTKKKTQAKRKVATKKRAQAKKKASAKKKAPSKKKAAPKKNVAQKKKAAAMKVAVKKAPSKPKTAKKAAAMNKAVKTSAPSKETEGKAEPKEVSASEFLS